MNSVAAAPSEYHQPDPRVIVLLLSRMAGFRKRPI